MLIKINEDYIEQCIKSVKKHLQISYYMDIIIDFTAKNGEFTEYVHSLVKTAFFYDNEPLDPEVKQLDFLNLNFDKFDKTFLSGLWYDNVHIIGCPPYDKVEEYVAAACNFAESVSFILPNKTIPSIFPLRYKCVSSIDLDTALMFQIWVKKRDD